MNDNLDPQALALAKSIRKTETGTSSNPYQEKGASGEFGAYQFMPATYKSLSKKYLGDENAEPSVENQNKIAYSEIKRLKDEGHTPAQIASIWNSGKADAYKNNATGTNSKGVRYDVPDYVAKVSSNYRELSGQPSYNPKPFSQPENSQADATQPDNSIQKESPKSHGILDSLENVGAGIASSLGSAGLGLAQGAAKLVGANSLANRIGSRKDEAFVNPTLPSNQSLDTKSAKVGKAIGTAIPYIAGGELSLPATVAKDTLTSFGQSGGDLGQAAKIGSTSGLLGLGGKAFSLLKGSPETALKTIIQDVAPEVTAKTFKGSTKSGILGKVSSTVDKSVQKIAETVNKTVPDFAKLPTYTDKLNAVKSTLGSMAEELQQAVRDNGYSRIYSFKDLASKMGDVEMPFSVKADKVLERQFDLAKNAAMKIAKDKGGTIDGLFNARKDFDQLVAKEFPTLYERTNAPMRNAITSMRDVMNEFIEKGLPDGLGYKTSLKNQRSLFQAIDNLSPKAFKELGSTRATRFADKYPKVKGMLKFGAGTAAGALGAGGAIRTYDKITGN